MNQFVDVTGGALLTSFTAIDTSNFLTVARANALYVNEAGDDIDMRNNKITNVPIPLKNTDVTNKEYVDDLNDRLRKNVRILVTEIEKSNRNIATLAVEVAKSERKLGELKNEFDLEIKKLDALVKEHKQFNTRIHDEMGRNNASILNTLRTDSRAKQFGYTLDIGVHLNIPANKSASVGKVTSHDIAFPFRLYETMTNLQVTLVGHTGEWKDDISCYIRNWRINTVYKNLKDTPEMIQSTLTIELYTFRVNGEHHWGIHLHAYLLVNIFNDNLLVIKNSI